LDNSRLKKLSVVVQLELVGQYNNSINSEVRQSGSAFQPEGNPKNYYPYSLTGLTITAENRGGDLSHRY
jgi:hypothetical protein